MPWLEQERSNGKLTQGNLSSYSHNKCVGKQSLDDPEEWDEGTTYEGELDMNNKPCG